jgi:hypothetical protein
MHALKTFGRRSPGTLGEAPGALGDILPTIVTADDAATLLNDVNNRVTETEDEFNKALIHKKITDAEFVRWQTFATRWREYWGHQTQRSWMFDAKYVMDRTDGFDQERISLRKWLRELAPDETPGPDHPATMPPNPGEWTLNVNLLLAVVGIVAVAYVAGPPLRAWAMKRSAEAPKKPAAARP